jgi:hypothetical protein
MLFIGGTMNTRSTSSLLLGCVGALAGVSGSLAEAHAEPAGVVASLGDSGVRRFGVMADAGVPDGATASLVFRPIRMVRLHAGGGYNMVSTGVRAGVSVVPLSSWVSPTVTVDVGRYAEGDANPLARTLSGDSTVSSPMLERVGYDYLNAHVGLELGRTWATFYLHAGMSRVSGQIRGLEEAAEGDVTISEDPNVTMWAPSARIGLIVYVAK